MKYFVKSQTLTEYQLRYWDAMAKRYAKSPIECLMPKGDYTCMEAYIFNSVVFTFAYNEEQKEIAKANKARKRAK